MSALKPRPGILDIKAYVPGRSSVAGRSDVARLAANESALGTSPLAVAAYHEAGTELNRYPDGDATVLRAALAAFYSLEAAQIVCGAGSDELLHLLCQAYVGPGDEVIYSAHGFTIYPLFTLGVGAKPVAVPERDYTTDIDAIRAAVTERTRMIFIANPNNPTGTYVDRAALLRLLNDLPAEIGVVVDSAYAEFVTDGDYTAGADLVDAFPNVIMTRTFSKIYGLAALRFGWAYARPDVIDVINRIRGPFNVSSPAQAAVRAALHDTEFTEAARQHNLKWRTWLTQEITRLGLRVLPSAANFIAIQFPGQAGGGAGDADAFLTSRGFLLRRLEAYGMPDFLRLTVGREHENQGVVSALQEFLSHLPNN